ncbi:MAG: glycosyltransferase family 1 protein, partial [Candidatus Rokuibacteriota bacterium]
MHIAVLSSTPLNAREGSGTFVGIAGLARGLRALGHQIDVRPLGRRSGFHTFDRWRYNVGVAISPPRGVDLVLGVDLDGFIWARRRRVPFIASLKGVIADELQNERGWVRTLLSVQARWERLNTERADLVMVTSRYCAEVVR